MKSRFAGKSPPPVERHFPIAISLDGATMKMERSTIAVAKRDQSETEE
jgi:hypothetical protein